MPSLQVNYAIFVKIFKTFKKKFTEQDQSQA